VTLRPTLEGNGRKKLEMVGIQVKRTLQIIKLLTTQQQTQQQINRMNNDKLTMDEAETIRSQQILLVDKWLREHFRHKDRAEARSTPK